MRRGPAWFGVALLLALAMPTWATSSGEAAAIGGVNPGQGEGALPTEGSQTGDGGVQSRPATVTGMENGAAGQYGTLLPLAGAIDPNVYRVGPGDMLVLQVYGQVSKTMPIEVDPEGFVLVPGVGDLHVDGRTLADVRRDILARMIGQFHNVGIEVRLGRLRTFRVYLTGQIRNPGPMMVTGAYRVGDVLGTDMMFADASHRRIEVVHTSGQVEVCDLDRMLRNGDNTHNPWLRAGDIIKVPSATEFMYVQGAVARPGRFEVGENDSLLTLLNLAGDPLPSALLESIMVVSFHNESNRSESLQVSIEDVYSHRNNPAVHEGTHAYVYFMPRYHQEQETAIVGEVLRPGPYPIVEGRTRLSQLVNYAGGFLPSADLTAIRVHRRSTMAGEKDPELDRLLRLSRNELTASEYEVLRTKLAGLREDYRVDWHRLQDDPSNDVLLRDGDLVRVERLVLSIRVDGEVRRPGIINFNTGGRVEDYVAKAGGFTTRAWESKVRVTRAVTGQTLLARNVRALDPGDLIWVPERPDVTVWDVGARLLTTLAQIATVIIAIRSVK